MDRYDVIIAGCGPVGAAAANLLGHHGVSTLVIEKDQEPYLLPRAIHFDHEIMRIFQSAGMAEELLPHLTTPAGAMFFGADRRVISQFRANVRTNRLGWASSYNFYQPDLERVLRDSLARRPSVRLVVSHLIEEVSQDDHGVRVVARGDGGTIEARASYLLACDGGRSTVRKQIGVDLTDLDFDEPWIVVDTFVDGPLDLPELHGTPDGVDMQDVLFIVGDPARPTSIIPGVGKHRRFEFMLLPHEDPNDYDDRARVSALIEPFVKDRPHEIIRCAVYRFHALLAERWQVGRVFLVGDAAHQTPPFFGQGMCHGVRDAANLAWKLKLVLDGAASPTLLDSYQPERLPQVRKVVEASVRAGQNLCTLDPARAARRDEEMGAVAARVAPGYVEIIPAITGGVTGPVRDGVGARFIQPPVATPDGRAGLLDDVTGGGFVLICRDRALLDAAITLPVAVAAVGLRAFHLAGPETERDRAVLVDTTGELQNWFDARQCAGVIVRPDAYVHGVFGNAGELRELLATLAAQLAPGDRVGTGAPAATLPA